MKTHAHLSLISLSAAILVLFSISWLLSKHIVADMPVMYVTGLRLMATSGALWSVQWMMGWRRAPVASIPVAGFFLLSLLGFTLYFLCSFAALNYIQASELTMVLSMIPGMTYLLGTQLLGFSFSWKKMTGISMITAGAVAFNLHREGSALISAQGVVLAMLAALSYALFGIFSKKIIPEGGVIRSLAWITLMASACFVPLFVMHPQPLLALSASQVANVVVLGAVCSAPVYVIYQKLLARGGVIYANAIGVLAPGAVTLSEWLMGTNTALTYLKSLALLATMAGIVVLYLDTSAQAQPLKK